jgi:hypothetical protein
MNIKIYQIYHRPELAAKLDLAFVPYDHCEFTKNNPEESLKWREWPIIRQHGLARAQADGADVWGFVSYAFNEKTNTTGQQFINFIQSNPDNDVWFMEPRYFPVNPFMNPWIQGDMFHPGISNIVNGFLQVNGKPIDVRKIPMPICWYNFFAGTEKFWARYFNMVDRMLAIADSNLEFKHILLETGPEHRGTTTTPYFIFVVERLFPTMLALTDIKYAGLHYRHNDFNVPAEIFDTINLLYKH